MAVTAPESTVAVPPAAQKAGFDLMHQLLGHFAGWLGKHRDRVQLSYLIPERDGYGWYVIQSQPAFDFALSRELTDFGQTLIRQGYAIHATLLPGSVQLTVPSDGIAVVPSASGLGSIRA